MPFNEPSDLAGIELQSSDGDVIGRVSAVHVPDGSHVPLFVQVPSDESEADLIVPLTAASVESGMLLVPYATEAIEDGPTIEPDAILSVAEAVYVLDYYEAGEIDTGGHSLTERASRALEEAVRGPVRPLPPIVVTKPGHVGDRLPGFGDDAETSGSDDPA